MNEETRTPEQLWEEHAFTSDLDAMEHQCLIECIKARLQFGKVVYVEIGVAFGGTFNLMLETFKDQDIYCIGIDQFEDHKNSPDNTHIGGTATMSVLNEALKAKGHTKFGLAKGYSFNVMLAMNLLPNAVIFVDGNHQFKTTMLDFLTAYALIHQGYIVLHNSTQDKEPDWRYYQSDGGPYRVVQQVLKTVPVVKAGVYGRSTVLFKP